MLRRACAGGDDQHPVVVAVEHHRRGPRLAGAASGGGEQHQAVAVHAVDFAARAELLDDLLLISLMSMPLLTSMIGTRPAQLMIRSPQMFRSCRSWQQ